MRISDWSSDVCSSDDPRPRIPSIQHEVVAAAPLEDVGQRRGIEPIPYTERKRLGSAGHEYSREHIVADLGHLPHAAVARVEDDMDISTEHVVRGRARFEVPPHHTTQHPPRGA